MTITITPKELLLFEEALENWHTKRFDNIVQEVYRTGGQNISFATDSFDRTYSRSYLESIKQKLEEWEKAYPRPTALQFFFSNKEDLKK